jgi:glycine oxidase
VSFVRDVDYLIVGQGLAGSMVACLLEMQGKNVLVIDNAHRKGASLAAAGIMNPITGKRLNRPHLVDQLLQMAFETYPRVERFLGGPIFQRRSVLRILKSEDETKQWKLRLASGEYAKYLGSTAVTDAEFVENRHGGFEVAQAGLLDVPGFVRRTRDRLLLANKLIESNFEYGELRPSKEHVRWGDYTVNAVIFCEGYQMMHTRFSIRLRSILRKGRFSPCGPTVSPTNASYSTKNGYCGRLPAKSRQEQPTHGINWMKSRALRLGMKSSDLCAVSSGSTSK